MSQRIFYAAVALLCAGLLGFGYYLQFGRGLEPCPLCIFQRLAYMGVGGAALVGVIHGPCGAWRYVYHGAIVLFAGIGAAVAGRQVWLQHLPPDRVPECGPGLDYMLDVFPLADVIRMAFTGSGECAQVDWTFLGLSIAEWSLFWFVAIAIAAIMHLAFRRAG